MFGFLINKNKMTQNLIVDLDETLIHTFTNRAKFDAFECKYGEIKYDFGELYGVLRPNVKSFIAWCSGNYNQIGVWSAGKREYVEIIVDLLFKGRKPAFVWCWENCDSYVNEYGLNLYHKPLEFVYDLVPGFTPKNTIFIDDALHSELCNAGNMIVVPPFHPEEFGGGPDIAFIKVKKLLKTLKTAKDVRLVEKKLN